MRPQMTRGRNECLRGAVATLLDRPYGHTPKVAGGACSDDEFWGRWARWSYRNGYRPIILNGARYWMDHCARAGWHLRDISWRPDYWIAVTNYRNGNAHACVVDHSYRLLWDPSFPERKRVNRRGVLYGIAFEEL